MILVIKHIEIEGPGSIAEFFRHTAWDFSTVELSKGQKLPGYLDGLEAIISLGGPMNVYEEEKHPFLKEEDSFLKEALRQEIPVLGICLGAQLLAKAASARVNKAPQKEIGWSTVTLTEEADCDPFFAHLPRQLRVFQWHEDTFDLPHSGVLLAAGEVCANQAFRCGRNAYGLQFHLEINPQMLQSWVKEYMPQGQDEVRVNDMLAEAGRREGEFSRQANLICLNFSRVIKDARGVKTRA